jgi:hypothetical protein
MKKSGKEMKKRYDGKSLRAEIILEFIKGRVDLDRMADMMEDIFDDFASDNSLDYLSFSMDNTRYSSEFVYYQPALRLLIDRDQSKSKEAEIQWKHKIEDFIEYLLPTYDIRTVRLSYILLEVVKIWGP